MTTLAGVRPTRRTRRSAAALFCTALALGSAVFAQVPSFGWPGVPFLLLDASPRWPAIATSTTGTWVAIWDGSLARSTDDGVTWTRLPLSLSLRPSLATDRSGNWVAVWDTSVFGGDSDLDVAVMRSGDDGITWSVPAPLNSDWDIDVSTDTSAQVVTDRAGNWLTVWHGPFSGPADIRSARSTDNGVTWTDPALVVPSAPLLGVPALAMDEDGVTVVAFEGPDLLGAPDSDILIARSTDHGATWSTVSSLHPDAATDVRNDIMPHVATDDAGTWVAVWGSTSPFARLWVARSTDGGVTWSLPAQLDDAAQGVSTFADIGPYVHADGAGTWLAAWGGTATDPELDIRVARSDDGGASWSAVELLNDTGRTDKWNDNDPALAVDGQGTWIAAWDTLDGVAFARSVACQTDADCPSCETCETILDRCVVGARAACFEPTDPRRVALGFVYSELGNSRLTSKWTSTGAAAASDFGDPLTTDGYAFCAFDESGSPPRALVRGLVPPGGECGPGRPCWTSSNGTFRYVNLQDYPQNPHGIQKMLLKAKPNGSVTIKLNGRGYGLDRRPDGLPRAPLALPIHVQLQSANGGCWDAHFPVASPNDLRRFKAKGG